MNSTVSACPPENQSVELDVASVIRQEPTEDEQGSIAFALNSTSALPHADPSVSQDGDDGESIPQISRIDSADVHITDGSALAVDPVNNLIQEQEPRKPLTSTSIAGQRSESTRRLDTLESINWTSWVDVSNAVTLALPHSMDVPFSDNMSSTMALDSNATHMALQHDGTGGSSNTDFSMFDSPSENFGSHQSLAAEMQQLRQQVQRLEQRVDRAPIQREVGSDATHTAVQNDKISGFSSTEPSMTDNLAPPQVLGSSQALAAEMQKLRQQVQLLEQRVTRTPMEQAVQTPGSSAAARPNLTGDSMEDSFMWEPFDFSSVDPMLFMSSTDHGSESSASRVELGRDSTTMVRTSPNAGTSFGQHRNKSFGDSMFLTPPEDLGPWINDRYDPPASVSTGGQLGTGDCFTPDSATTSQIDVVRQLQPPTRKMSALARPFVASPFSPANLKRTGMSSPTRVIEDIAAWTGEPFSVPSALSADHLAPISTAQRSSRASSVASTIGQGDYVCDGVPGKGCGKRFKTRSALSHHVRCHKPPRHVCTRCNSGFYYMKDLSRHMKTHSRQDRHLICNDKSCKYHTTPFARRDHLERHILSTGHSQAG